MEQLGGTEMHNCIQLQQLGVTEKFKSVALRLKTRSTYDLGMTEMEESVRPKHKKKFWKFKSMTDRGLRVLLTRSGSI